MPPIILRPDRRVILNDVPFDFQRAERPRAGFRVVHLNVSDSLYVCRASDVRIVMSPGISMGVLRINPGLHRIHVKGGSFEAIQFVPPRDASWVSTDLVFEDCSFSASLGAHLRAYARRIEFIRCKCEGSHYAFFASDDVGGGITTRYELEDFLFYGCDFRVNGDESACVRLHDITRLVVKNCAVATGGNYGLRIHGNSSNLFVRNLLCKDSDAPGNGIHLGKIGKGSNAADRASINGVWLREVTSRVTFQADIDLARDGSVRSVIADRVWSYRPEGSFSSWGYITSLVPPERPDDWTIRRSGARFSG